MRYFAAVRHEAFPYRVVETPEAMQIREEIESLLPRCRRIVTVGGVPSAARLVAGEGPGEVATVNLLSATFELDRYNLRRDDLMGVMETALAHHRSRVRGAWFRTLNPFYWLDMALSVAEILPFLPVRALGRDARRAANSPAGSRVRVLLRLAALGGLIWVGLSASGLGAPALELAEGGFDRFGSLGSV